MPKRDIDDVYGGGPAEELPLLAAAKPAAAAGPFARSTIVPSPDEVWLARLLWRHQGRGNPISIREIIENRNLRFTGEYFPALDERGVKALVESLKRNHREPIGALRTSPGGYFIMRDIEDERAGVDAYLKQVLTSLRTWRTVHSTQFCREIAGQLRLALEGGEE